MHPKEDIIEAINDISEEQMKRLSDWLHNLKRERAKPPTGKLGLKKSVNREELYEDVLSHRL
jgi:hypothetical protein